ncbi:ATP-dependent helicase [Rhodoferax sp. AJA081-3]|uniref:UvrD-helicase domain-containing protein n=1 Tax=Rhodoferax sp. AJA081-3 TaxID=2752316 RepID=UPI001ADF9BC7|nr:ATP-dependent helicase [Rhodoferax sp. AJA081-3]QTN30064.1 ATP-dependent helicase [Rhodoferax sp. AJA081-3]
MTSPPLFHPQNITPSRQQVELQTSNSPSIIVDANAGAAKTTSLALKVAEVLEQQRRKTGRYWPKKILTLTYTEVAGLAFRRALEKIGVPAEVVKELWINTFDEFAVYMLQEPEGSRARTVKTPEELKGYIAQCMDEVRTRAEQRGDHHLQVPSDEGGGFYEQLIHQSLRIKGKMVLPEARWLGERVDRQLADNAGEDYTVLKVLERLERLRRPSEEEPPLFRAPGDATYDLASTLGDMSVEMPQNLFSKWPGGLHLLCVDEFHDMNAAMFTLLRRLLESNTNAVFCGVGDPDQVLHQKAGAEPKFMDAAYFARETGRATTVMHLPGSYRFAVRLAELAGNLAAKPYASFAKHETEVHPFFYAAPLECAQKIVEDAAAWQRHGGAMGQFVVLLRHPHQSVLIENFLLEQKIPYRTYPFPTYLHRPEVLMVRALLAASRPEFELVTSHRARHRMVQALVDLAGVQFDYAESEAESQDERLHAAVKEILHDQSLWGTFLKRQVIAKADPAIRRRLEAAMAVAATHTGDTMLDAMLQALDMPGLAAHHWVERQRCADAVAHLDGLKQAAMIFDSAAAFFRHINELDLSYEKLGDAKARKNSLILTDIPSVKGLEFERVTIPFIARGEFPADDGGTLDDERNLMYVAMTRCSRILTLMFSQKRPSAFEEAMLSSERA